MLKYFHLLVAAAPNNCGSVGYLALAPTVFGHIVTGRFADLWQANLLTIHGANTTTTTTNTNTMNTNSSSNSTAAKAIQAVFFC